MADVHLVASSSASSCFRGKPLVPPLHNKLTGCAGPLPYWRAQWNLDHLLYGRSTNRAEVAGSGVVRGGAACAHAPRAPPTVAPVATGHHDVVPQGIAAYHTHLFIIHWRHGHRHLRGCGQRVLSASGTCRTIENEHRNEKQKFLRLGTR